MQYLDVGLGFAALLALCGFLNRRCGVAGGRTPLLGASVILLWLTVAGVAGVLRAGGWALYALSAAAGVLAMVPVKGAKRPAPPLFDFGFGLFWCISLVMAVVFAIRQPLFAEWDELSFWGAACKLVSLNGQLYTTASAGWDWVGTQQPGAILVGYFFQFFGRFAPWKSFVGYNVLMFAAFAGLVSAIGGDGEGAAASWRRYTLGLPLALVCVLSPYLLTEYCRILEVTGTYMSTYGDIPAGILAGGAAAWYFAARRGARPVPGGQNTALAPGMWGIFVVLAAAGIIKENAFPVVLVAAGILAFDTIVSATGAAWWRRGGAAAAMLASPVITYMLWNRHIQAVVAARESAGQVGTTSLSLPQVVLMGFQQLFSPARRTATFSQVLADMGSAFVNTKLTLVGSLSEAVLRRVLGPDNLLTRLMGTGVMVVLLVWLIFAVAALVGRSPLQRWRVLWTAVLSTLGFVGYYWVLILSYAFIFKAWQSAGLSDYNRYVGTYYLFWFLLALSQLACAASGGPDTAKKAHAGAVAVQAARGPKPPQTWGAAFALALSVLALGASARMLPAQMTVLAYPAGTFAEQRRYAEVAEEVSAQVEAAGLPGSIFFVSTSDNGIRYFTYSYHLLPLPVDYSFGGGPIGPADMYNGSQYYHAYSCAELAAYLAGRGCDYIFLDDYDAVFANEYAPLFTDALAAAGRGVQVYARVTDAEDLQYAPVEVTAHA